MAGYAPNQANVVPVPQLYDTRFARVDANIDSFVAQHPEGPTVWHIDYILNDPSAGRITQTFVFQTTFTIDPTDPGQPDDYFGSILVTTAFSNAANFTEERNLRNNPIFGVAVTQLGIVFRVLIALRETTNTFGDEPTILIYTSVDSPLYVKRRATLLNPVAFDVGFNEPADASTQSESHQTNGIRKTLYGF